MRGAFVVVIDAVRDLGKSSRVSIHTRRRTGEDQGDALIAQRGRGDRAGCVAGQLIAAGSTGLDHEAFPRRLCRS